MEAIRDKVFYSVVGFEDKTKMATFCKDGYKRFENAKKTADKLIKDGYDLVNIRKEEIYYRDDNNEFSSSGIIETLTN